MLNKQTIALAVMTFIGIVSYLIIKPFLLAIIGATILAILFNPLHNKILKITKAPKFSAAITCLIGLIIVLIPAIFVGQALYNEATVVFKVVASQNVSSEKIVGSVTYFYDTVASYLPGVTSSDVRAFSINIVKSVSNWLRLQVIAIPNKILLVLLSIFLFYYMLCDGRKLIKWIYEGLPLTKTEQSLIDSRLSNMTHAVVYGQIVTAIAQGLVAMIGYWAFGFKAPVIWGIITMFFSLVPFVGTAIIWVPASIYLIYSGLDIGTWWNGVALFAYGAIIINTVDNVLRPIFIGATSRMHHAIALLGVIGGLSVFGFIGIFAGPLILSLFVTMYDILIRKNPN